MSFRYYSEYTLNLYHGCTHACDYCYAPSLIHDERSWGSYVDAKINAPEVLSRELRHAESKVVFISSASDPYQPVEARYRLTRKCLEVLLRNQFPVLILTRSPLILRDLDILEEFDWLRVGFSISSVSERYHEPGVVPVEKRVEALQKLRDRGITTWVSLAPIIPGAPMIDLELLFSRLAKAGVSCISSGLLRFNGYAKSESMFKERSGLHTSQALVGGFEVMRRVNALARLYGLDEPDNILSWTKESERTLESFGSHCTPSTYLVSNVVSPSSSS